MTETHIFLDNSNIFGGAQRAANELEHAPWQAVRIDYKNLLRLLVYNKSHRSTSMLAGSVPPGNDALWAAASEAGFDTTLLKRVENDDGRLIEQGVDESIHLRIANILLDSDVPGIIVLATGDGGDTEQGSSFTHQVIRAAKRGWQVEVWSWSNQLSKKLRDTRLKYPRNVTVYKLDEWYKSIVFIKGGTYSIMGTTKTLTSRPCDPLNLTETRFSEAAA